MAAKRKTPPVVGWPADLVGVLTVTVVTTAGFAVAAAAGWLAAAGIAVAVGGSGAAGWAVAAGLVGAAARAGRAAGRQKSDAGARA